MAVPREYLVGHLNGAVNVGRAEGSEARVPGLRGAAVPAAARPRRAAEVALDFTDTVT